MDRITSAGNAVSIRVAQRINTVAILLLVEVLPPTAWLLDQFEHLPTQSRFVFISLHHPPAADSIEGNSLHDERPNERALGVTLDALAKTSKAQIIVVAGHLHSYQRFFQDGVTYLVSGRAARSHIRSHASPPTFSG